MQQISTGFASWLRYCSDVVRRRPTKLCMMFIWPSPGLVHYIYIFWGLLPLTEFSPVQNSLYVQVLCSSILTALQLLQDTPAAGSAKLCGVVQGMELRNFHRGRHLYAAGRPSRWASAHILVWRFFAACIFSEPRAAHFIPAF